MEVGPANARARDRRVARHRRGRSRTPSRRAAARSGGCRARASRPATWPTASRSRRRSRASATVDVLVANAGIAHYLPFAEMPPELIERADAASTGSAPPTRSRPPCPGMLERRRGHIVIVSSGAGIRSFPGAAVYGATKAAQRGFGEALRHELQGHGRRADDGLPGPDPQLAPRPREGAHAGLVPAGPRGRRPSRSRRRSSRPSRRTGARSSTRRTCGCCASSTGCARRWPTRMLRRIMDRSAAPVKLPLSPPLKPQLAKSARELPEGDDWCYEPKWDGFRTIVFRDGDEVHLQSRNGKPMNRYFPEVVEQALALPADALRARRRDGGDGRRRPGVRPALAAHPPGRLARGAARARRRRPRSWPSTCWPRATRRCSSCPTRERRERLAALVADPVELTPSTDDPEAAGEWLAGTGEGVIAKEASAPYRPGERVGMVKIKRVRTADAVVAAFRFGKEPGTVGSLILGLYDDGRRAARRRAHLELPRQAEARAARAARALPHRRARLGRAEPLEVRRGARLGGPAARAGLRGRLRPHHRPADPSRREVPALAQRQGPAGMPHSLSCATDPAPDRARRRCSRRRRRPQYRSRPTTRSWATAGARGEIYVYGMRNPYRWSFDRATGDMWIGDVGGSHRTRRRSTTSPRAQHRGRQPRLELPVRAPRCRPAARPPTTSRRCTPTRAARTS